MQLVAIAKRVEKFTVDNSPLILTVVGVTGTITTALLSVKGTIKAVRIIDQERIDREYLQNVPDPRVYGVRELDLTRREMFKLVWKEYIPPVGVGVLTVVAIVGANQIGTRRAAALAAAYSMSEHAFTEYRDKVVEKMGLTKEKGVRDDLAQERVNKNPMGDKQIIIAGSGDVICHEAFTGRYFNSSMEELKSAQNAINYQINNNVYASLSDLYDRLGLKHTSESNEVGWNSDKLLEMQFSTVLNDKGQPCLSFDYQVVPIRNYYNTH